MKQNILIHAKHNSLGKNMLNEDISQSDIEKRIEDWNARISDLYSSIKEWLASATSYTTREHSEVTMYEALMQKYQVKPKQLKVLDIYDGDKIIATFKPIGLWVTGANGRIDILSKKGSVLLVDKADRFKSPNWFGYTKNKIESTAFNKEYLLTMLTEIQQ
jgi:hypothetical protein